HRALHGSTIDVDLFCAREAKRRGVVDAANPAADAERDEHTFGDLIDHIKHDVAAITRCRDVVENQFVQSLMVVLSGLLNWVSNILGVYEFDALRQLAVAYVETGDHSFA